MDWATTGLGGQTGVIRAVGKGVERAGTCLGRVVAGVEAHWFRASGYADIRLGDWGRPSQRPEADTLPFCPKGTGSY